MVTVSGKIGIGIDVQSPYALLCKIWKSKLGFHRPVLARWFKTFKLVAKMFQRTIALLCSELTTLLFMDD